MTTVPHYCPGCGGLHTTQVPPPTSGTPEPVARNLLAEQQEDADWAAPPPATPGLREALERITDRLGVLAETSAIEGNPNWTAGSRASFSLPAPLLLGGARSGSRGRDDELRRYLRTVYRGAGAQLHFKCLGHVDGGHWREP